MPPRHAVYKGEVARIIFGTLLSILALPAHRGTIFNFFRQNFAHHPHSPAPTASPILASSLQSN